MRIIDEVYMQVPFYGSRKMTALLIDAGYTVNRKRIQRLMRTMGLKSVAPKPGTSLRNLQHKVYPYLLRNYAITRKNEVWSTDISYVPMPPGFMYLVAVIDWFSRYVLSWEISNTLDTHFCLEALHRALSRGKPIIFNTDQGSQFTSHEFTHAILNSGIHLSMDGRGRALDNIFIEHLWRSLKYECVYLNAYESGCQTRESIGKWFTFYNDERPHSTLNGLTPKEVYQSEKQQMNVA